MDSNRVEHRVSGQQGRLINQGVWYSGVWFDGDDGPSWVDNDSLRRVIGSERMT